MNSLRRTVAGWMVMCLCLCTSIAFAQEKAVYFGGSGDDVMLDCGVLSDGSIVVVGYTTSTDGMLSMINHDDSASAWILCISPDGAVKKNKVYSEERFTNIYVSSTDSIVVTSKNNDQYRLWSVSLDTMALSEIAFPNSFDYVQPYGEGYLVFAYGGEKPYVALTDQSFDIIWKCTDGMPWTGVQVPFQHSLYRSGTSYINGIAQAVTSFIDESGQLKTVRTHSSRNMSFFQGLIPTDIDEFLAYGGERHSDEQSSDSARATYVKSDGSVLWDKIYLLNGKSWFEDAILFEDAYTLLANDNLHTLSVVTLDQNGEMLQAIEVNTPPDEYARTPRLLQVDKRLRIIYCAEEVDTAHGDISSYDVVLLDGLE